MFSDEHNDNEIVISNDIQQSNENEVETQQKTKIEELNDLLKHKLGEKIIIFSDYTSVF